MLQLSFGLNGAKKRIRIILIMQLSPCVSKANKAQYSSLRVEQFIYNLLPTVHRHLFRYNSPITY